MAVEAPAEPVDGHRRCPCCDGSGFEPIGLTESPRTGRRYAEKVTASGVRYGLEHGGRFVMVEAGGHVIEKGRGGHPSLDRFVDELADKLGKRAAAVELAKERGKLTLPKQREALDDLLQRLFRWPGEWSRVRLQMRDTVKSMGLSSRRTTVVLTTLCQPECRDTWDEQQNIA